MTHDAKVAARAERVIYLEDGRIRDEYRPGSLEDAKEGKREKTLDDWLAKMGF